jgi:hypothetical protein
MRVRVGSGRRCIACYEDFLPDQVFRLPCQHDYCHACTLRLFRQSLGNVTLRPPSCCSIEIPLNLVRGVLDPELVAQVEAKLLEHHTVDKTYCAHRPCSEFIKPSAIQNSCGTCSTCHKETCTLCKEKAHTGRCEAPRDDALEALAKLAEEKKWRRCWKCHRFVERTSGCNHMS